MEVTFTKLAGRRDSTPEWFSRVEPELLESDLVRRIMARLDDFAVRWHALQAGGSATLAWPRRVPASTGTARPRDKADPRRRDRRSPRG